MEVIMSRSPEVKQAIIACLKYCVAADDPYDAVDDCFELFTDQSGWSPAEADEVRRAVVLGLLKLDLHAACHPTKKG
jgi:hypothetical protein